MGVNRISREYYSERAGVQLLAIALLACACVRLQVCRVRLAELRRVRYASA